MCRLVVCTIYIVGIFEGSNICGFCGLEENHNILVKVSVTASFTIMT